MAGETSTVQAPNKTSKNISLGWLIVLAVVIVGGIKTYDSVTRTPEQKAIDAARVKVTSTAAVAGKTMMCSGSQIAFNPDGTYQNDGFANPERTVPYRTTGTYSQDGDALTVTSTHSYITDPNAAAQFPDLADSRSVMVVTYSVAKSGNQVVLTPVSRTYNGQPRKPSTNATICN